MNYIYLLIVSLFTIVTYVINFTRICKPPKGAMIIICLIIGFISLFGLGLVVWSPASGWLTNLFDIFKGYPSFIKDIIFGNINNEDISREWYDELIIRYYQLNLSIVLIGIIVVVLLNILRPKYMTSEKSIGILKKVSGIYD